MSKRISKKELDNLMFIENIISTIEEEPLVDVTKKNAQPLEKFLVHLSDLLYVVAQIYRGEHSLPHVKNYKEKLYYPRFLNQYKEIRKFFLK